MLLRTLFVLRNNCNINYLSLQARNKSKTHWAKLKKKTGPKYKALNHYDDFYGSVFGSQWEPIREALLRKSKYVAVVNNYGDPEATSVFLKNKGAHNLGELIAIQEEHNKKYLPPPETAEVSDNSDNKLAQYVQKLQTEDISSIYPQNQTPPDRLQLKNTTLGETKSNEKEETSANKNITLEQSIENAEIDQSRIIDPSLGFSSEALYQYLPATQLKGMDDWVPESSHYAYYSKDTDFPLAIEPETEFSFPEHLKVYTYEMGSESTMFPEPRRCQTGSFDYYPMDGGSVLAVLALCLSPGDRTLDLCSAPGGKALVALQTLLPDVLVCNDSSISRGNRMNHIFRDYLFDFATSNKWRERVVMTRMDGRSFTDDQGFDKVLVDVPCTTDRHSVNQDENNIFRPDRVKERLKIPDLQAQLLTNGLKLVRPGGAVVYATCSLSPIQNDGVVHMALKQAFEAHGIIAHVKDLTAPFSSLSSTMSLAKGQAAPRYGQLVLPSVAANFGPTYIARLVRMK